MALLTTRIGGNAPKISSASSCELCVLNRIVEALSVTYFALFSFV